MSFQVANKMWVRCGSEIATFFKIENLSRGRIRNVLSAILIAVLVPSSLAGTCTFFQNSNGYGCRLVDGVLTAPGGPFVIAGTHLPGFNDASVVFLYAVNSTLHFVPQQIFARFPNLERLELLDVDLRTLDQLWQNCNHLRYVRLENNTIAVIPSGLFWSCTSIETLVLNNCGIQEVQPLAFGMLANLRELSMQGNLISQLHIDTFTTTPSLVTLILTGAGIERIEPGTFRDLNNLTSIFLNNNQLALIENATFTNMPALSRLFINHNPLVNISAGAFGALPSLDTLEMTGGSLNRLTTNSFVPLPVLRALSLNNQRVAKIQRNFFNNFPALVSLNMLGNECVDRHIDLIHNNIILLEQCFWRFEGSVTTTTTTTTAAPTTTADASILNLSLGLLLSILILMKLNLW